MRAAMRKPSSLISWSHCGPEGAASLNWVSWGGIQRGSSVALEESFPTRGMEPQREPGAIVSNLYSLTKGQSAIRDWFRAPHDRTGNLPLFPGIFPDQLAQIDRFAKVSMRFHFLGS
jgi:hypothetical protein